MVLESTYKIAERLGIDTIQGEANILFKYNNDFLAMLLFNENEIILCGAGFRVQLNQNKIESQLHLFLIELIQYRKFV